MVYIYSFEGWKPFLNVVVLNKNPVHIFHSKDLLLASLLTKHLLEIAFQAYSQLCIHPDKKKLLATFSITMTIFSGFGLDNNLPGIWGQYLSWQFFYWGFVLVWCCQPSWHPLPPYCHLPETDSVAQTGTSPGC